LGLLAACSLAQQGCYRHVVGVRGLGGSTYDVSEPYQQNSKIDDWVFGERRSPNDKIVPPAPPRE
jgi:hypothetical protein